MIRGADPTANGRRKEVMFVDTGVADYQTLVGLSQMAQWAATRSGCDAIHVLSHGAEGQLRLGSLTLALDIAGLVAGTGHDQVVVAGRTEPGSDAAFDITYSVTGSWKNTFQVIDNRGSTAVTGTLSGGTFSGVPEGGYRTSNGRHFKASYAGGTDNDITLQDNTPPVFTTAAVTAVNEDSLYSYAVHTHDEDGDSVTVTATTQTVTITVDPVNHAPVFTSGQPETVTQGAVTGGLKNGSSAHRRGLRCAHGAPGRRLEGISVGGINPQWPASTTLKKGGSS